VSAYSVTFTTRCGGVSEGAFASLNLGLLTEDEPARVEENRRLLCARVGADAKRLAINRQTHGTVVNRALAGRRGTPGDGLWTDEPNLPLLVLAADCLPIVLTRSRGRRTVAVLHAGRTGLLDGVVEAGLSALGPVGLQAQIGPGIGVCCYDVGTDIAAAYRARFGTQVARRGRVDLRAAAERALRDGGVADVEHVDECTACNPSRYFSHRRDGPRTGRQGVIAYIA
jgi:YfiH family protein